MGNPWAEQQKKPTVPRFYVHTINFVLVVCAILLVLYLWKAYEYKQSDLLIKDMQTQLKEKQAAIDELKSIVEKQKSSVETAQDSMKKALDDLTKTKDTATKDVQRAKTLLELKEQQEKAVKYACLSSDECRKIYVDTTMQKFIITKGLNVTGLPAEQGLDYYQYFLAPVEVPEKFTFAELTFIKLECQSKWYETPGLFVTRFNYKLAGDANRKMQVIMNDRSAEILCAWIVDVAAAKYTLVQ